MADSKTLQILIKAKDAATATVQGVAKSFESLNKDLTNTSKVSSQATESISKVGKAASSSSNLLGRVGKAATSSFSKAKKSALSLKEELSGLNTTTNKVSAALATLGVGLGLSKIIKDGANFQHTMNIVKAVSQANTKEFKEMTDAAKEMGESTEYNAQQAAEGLLYLNRAGLGAVNSVKALPKALDLATAGNISLGESADIVTNVMSGMRLKISDLDEVADTMVKTINTSNTDMHTLSDSFAYGASTAAAYGYSIQQLSGLIGILGNNAIKGSSAGTGLRQAFSRVNKVFQYYGVSAKNADGSTKNLIDALQLLEDHAASPDLVTQLFGRIAANSVNALLGTGVSAIRTYISELDKAQGTSKNTAAQMRDDLVGDYKAFISIIDSYSNQFEEANTGVMRAFLQTLTKMLRDAKTEINAFINDSSDSILNNVQDVVEAVNYFITHIIAGVKTVILVFDAFHGGLLNIQKWAGEALGKDSWVKSANEGLSEVNAHFDKIALSIAKNFSTSKKFNKVVESVVKKTKEAAAAAKAQAEAEAKTASTSATSQAVAPRAKARAANPETQAVLTGTVSADKTAELEFAKFQALQTRMKAQLQQVWKANGLSAKEYYESLQTMAQEAYQKELDSIQTESNAKIEALQKSLNNDQSATEQQKTLNSIKTIQAETEARIYELKQKQLTTSAQIAQQEAAATTSEEQKKQKILQDATTAGNDTSTGEGREAAYQAELAQINTEYDQKLALLDQYHATAQEKETVHQARMRELAKATSDYEKQEGDARISIFSNVVDGMGDLMTNLNQMGLSNSKAGFAVYKAFATAQAVIQTYQSAVAAYNNGMTAGGPYAGVALASTYAGIAVAAGLAKIALINSAQPSGYAYGGQVQGPNKGARADNVTANLTPGEWVIDRPTSEHYGAGVMAAISSGSIPREVLSGYGGNVPSRGPKIGFATGGQVSSLDGIAATNKDTSSSGVTIVNVTDRTEVEQVLASSSGQKIIMNTISQNGDKIRRIASGKN